MSKKEAAISIDDPGLAARVRASDREAIEVVVRAYLGQVFRAARGAGLDAQAAEDITQATFATFIEKAASFEGRSQVRTWLFGILYRKVAEARRAVGRERSVEDIEDLDDKRFDARGAATFGLLLVPALVPQYLPQGPRARGSALQIATERHVRLSCEYQKFR